MQKVVKVRKSKKKWGNAVDKRDQPVYLSRPNAGGHRDARQVENERRTMSTIKEPTVKESPPEHFKVLKVMDEAVIGGTRPLGVVSQPKPVHYANAKGGMRLVDADDVRSLAKTAAQRLLNLAKI